MWWIKRVCVSPLTCSGPHKWPRGGNKFQHPAGIEHTLQNSRWVWQYVVNKMNKPHMYIVQFHSPLPESDCASRFASRSLSQKAVATFESVYTTVGIVSCCQLMHCCSTVSLDISWCVMMCTAICKYWMRNNLHFFSTVLQFICLLILAKLHVCVPMSFIKFIVKLLKI